MQALFPTKRFALSAPAQVGRAILAGRPFPCLGGRIGPSAQATAGPMREGIGRATAFGHPFLSGLNFGFSYFLPRNLKVCGSVEHFTKER